MKADICRQVSVCLRVFCGISFALKPFRDLQFMLGLHFTPVCVLLSVCSLHFTLSLHFTPGPQSAVRSPQSAVSVLHWSVWKFYKDLFLNFRVIWSVNQIVLFNGFLSDFVEITSCVYTKTIILSISVRNIYLAASRLSIYISRYSPWFQRIIVNYKRQSIKIIMSINEFIKLHKVYSLRGIHVLTGQ